VEVSKVTRALADRYKIERVLGQGGMATVYLAEDPRHRRRVAVKVMRPELAETLGTERFLREVEIAARLSHPHILPVFDSGQAGGFLYYVMPYIEGESLPARLARERQLPVAEAVRLGREVAEALAYAHGQGIIHRDIKPANILLSGGHALVADFGIARAVTGDGKTLTQTGLAIGTPQYMSPEQATGSANVDGRSDIYALGCVIYEMIAGEPPFTGPTVQAVIARSMTETARPLTATRQGLAPAVGAAVGRALAKSPADRFQTAAAFTEALTAAEDQVRTGSAATQAATPAAGSRLWLGFGVAALVLLTAFVVSAVRRGLPPWVLGVATVLILGGVATLGLTARAERRRRAGAILTGWEGLLTWRNAALGGVAALALWAMTATVLAMGAGAGAVGGAGRATPRVAILPFENQGAADDAYFADGIVDEVRGKLAKVGQLTMIASTSANQYRNTTKSPVEIARELRVDYLLIGKVRWAGAAGGARRVQVVPELVDGRTGATSWQQSFEADLTDVFQMQTTIAARVAGALGAALGSADQLELAARPTANPAAYDLYLKGKAIASNAATAQRQAAGFFEQAVALDSTFAEAWALLGRSLTSVFTNGAREPVVARRAGEAIDRGLRLAPGSATSHLAASRYHLLISQAPEAADREMELALAAAPTDADVLAQSANLDLQAGRFESALSKLTRARDLDPLSQQTLSVLLTAMVYLRRFDEAVVIGREALAVGPTDLSTMGWAVFAHVGASDLAGARAVIRETIGPVAATEVVAYLAGYNELAWVLEGREQDLLFRLTPAAFDNDRAWWGQALAIAAQQRGDRVRARAYADSALAISAEQSAANPDDPQLHALYGVMLAHAGRAAEAVREGERGVALAAAQRRTRTSPYATLQLVRVHIANGDADKAITLLEELLSLEYTVSPGQLRLDPSFAPLRGHPRFQRLLAQPARTP
jgi:serine/threonine-protein kinase